MPLSQCPQRLGKETQGSSNSRQQFFLQFYSWWGIGLMFVSCRQHIIFYSATIHFHWASLGPVFPKTLFVKYSETRYYISLRKVQLSLWPYNSSCRKSHFSDSGEIRRQGKWDTGQAPPSTVKNILVKNWSKKLCVDQNWLTYCVVVPLYLHDPPQWAPRCSCRQEV